jgi:catechol 2,3-dioxygenase-like lactoylglutathione lyase family enzyme
MFVLNRRYDRPDAQLHLTEVGTPFSRLLGVDRALIDSIDHVVLTTRDEAKCVEFYTATLGMKLERYGENRLALRFGQQKINVHQPGVSAGLKAHRPTPGSLDLCFIAAVPLEAVIARLGNLGVAIIEGPVQRAGAHGPIRSIYVRDPDDNLVEIAEYAP